MIYKAYKMEVEKDGKKATLIMDKALADLAFDKNAYLVRECLAAFDPLSVFKVSEIDGFNALEKRGIKYSQPELVDIEDGRP